MKNNLSNEVELIKLLKTNKGRGISYILNQAYGILGNPIVMFDTTYKLLAYTENIVNDDFLWNELTAAGTFSHKTVDFFSKEKFIDDVANTDIITVLKSNNLKYDRVNAKIFDKDNIHIANICIVACYKQFEAIDFKNIELICENLSNEIQKSEYYQKIESIFEETFINDLIEGKQIERNLIQNKIDEIYTNYKTNLYIAVIDITKYDHTLTHLAYFRDLFKTLICEFKYFIYLNNIVAIISIEEPLLNIKRDLSELSEFCAENNIYIGISSSFQNLFELQKYYNQAIYVLNYGLNIEANNVHNVFEYDNFRVDYFLNKIKSNTNIKDLCHPIIFIIQEYDKINNTSYYNILSAYLLTGINSKLAAEKLKMKYDDFNTQLKSISDTFGIDWNNDDLLDAIFLSIKITKCSL